MNADPHHCLKKLNYLSLSLPWSFSVVKPVDEILSYLRQGCPGGSEAKYYGQDRTWLMHI